MGILAGAARRAWVQPPRSGPEGAHHSRARRAAQAGADRVRCLNQPGYASQTVVLAPFLGFVRWRDTGREQPAGDAPRDDAQPRPESRATAVPGLLGRARDDVGYQIEGRDPARFARTRLEPRGPAWREEVVTALAGHGGIGRAAGWRSGSAKADRSLTIGRDRKKCKTVAAAEPRDVGLRVGCWGWDQG